MNNRIFIGLVSVTLLALSSGCQTCCKKRCNDCSNDRMPPPGATLGAPNTIPPAGIAPRSSYYSPQPEILLPDPRSSAAPAPVYGMPSARQLSPNQALKPVDPSAKIAPTEMPLGIPDFTIVKEGVWTGLRPDLDGLDWLQRNQVKKVIFLRDGTEEDLSDKQQIEKRGMAYESLIVKPETLNEELFRQFDLLIKTSKPVFVYDKTSSIKGYLWYVYFRVDEMLPADAARIRAERLGYRESGAPGSKELATAANRVIDNLK